MHFKRKVIVSTSSSSRFLLNLSTPLQGFGILPSNHVIMLIILFGFGLFGLVLFGFVFGLTFGDILSTNLMNVFRKDFHSK